MASYKGASTDKRQRLLSPLAFGIHYKVIGRIRAYLEEKAGASPFFFYEFFLERPFTRWDNAHATLKSSQAVTAPFLSRVVYQNRFLPALNETTLSALSHPDQIETVPLTHENLKTYWGDQDAMRPLLSETDVLKALIDAWRGKAAELKPPYFVAGSEAPAEDEGVFTTIAALSTRHLRKAYPQSIIDRVNKKKDKNFTSTALAKLREYELVLRPWLGSSSIKELAMVCASISTKAVFWGECILICPFGPGESLKDRPRWLRDLKNLVREAAEETYVPMLELLENYICEDDLQEVLKAAGIGESKRKIPTGFSYRGLSKRWMTANSRYLRRVGSGAEPPSRALKKMPRTPVTDHMYLSLFFQCSEMPERWKKDLTKLERVFVELWADRLGFMLEDAHAVRESLVFAKYLIASPAMVQRTIQATGFRHFSEDAKRGKDRAVKTALVIGGPGSGKDSMAQLVRLFSPGYRFGAIKTLNMAMFRPKEAAVPLLLGLEARGKGLQLSIDGFLTRAVLQPGLGPRGFSFILDELNSLDIDTQGALLRFLENAELQPLGAIDSDKKKFDVLVIGVMNEDPHMIMKRRAMERVLREKHFFGGVLGEVLYEMFRNQRRLRDDLYYRLIRGGEITLPDLRDRREDIPVLFYFIVSNDLRSLIPKELGGRVEVELPVYEALVEPSLAWDGNLRELQTVARHILATAVDDYEKKGSLDTVLTIRGTHARRILESHRQEPVSDG